MTSTRLQAAVPTCLHRLHRRNGRFAKRSGQRSKTATKCSRVLKTLKSVTERLRKEHGIKERIQVRQLPDALNPCDAVYAAYEYERRIIFVRIRPHYTTRFLHTLIAHELAHYWHHKHNAAHKKQMRKLSATLRKYRTRS